MEWFSEIEPQKRYRSPLLWGLVISLLVHFTTMVAKFSKEHPPIDWSQKTPSAPIELSEIPKELLHPSKKQKPLEPEIAETEDSNLKKEDPNARFLSDRAQMAEKQTKAQAIDDFRKKQGTGLKAKLHEGPVGVTPTGEANDAKENETEIAEGDTQSKKQGIKRNWKTLSLRDLSVQGDGSPTAATDDKLDGVAEGERTILSTREFRYFSYYNRIKDLLRQYWKPNVEEKMYKMWRRGRTVAEEEYTTRILVLLDSTGGIQRIQKVSGSGVAELDEAAVEAFQKAGPFPNPPKGIIEPDGFVRIRWDFILKTESSPRIQYQTAGQAPN